MENKGCDPTLICCVILTKLLTITAKCLSYSDE